MLSTLLLLSASHAGVVSDLTPEELHLAECKPVVLEETKKNGADGEIEAWKQCLTDGKIPGSFRSQWPWIALFVTMVSLGTMEHRRG